MRRLRRRRHRARATPSAATRPSRQAVAPIVEAGVDPDPDRRRPRLHPSAPSRDAITRTGRRHRLRLAHRRLGQATSERSTTTARGCAARSRRASSTSPSIEVGLRGPIYPAARLDRPADELGLDYLTTEEVLLIGPRGGGGPHPRPGGRPGRPSSPSTSLLDPAYAPGTGTPEPGGPVRARHAGHRPPLTGIGFVGFDVLEVIPAYDRPSQTAVPGRQSRLRDAVAGRPLPANVVVARGVRHGSLNDERSRPTRLPERILNPNLNPYRSCLMCLLQ